MPSAETFRISAEDSKKIEVLTGYSQRYFTLYIRLFR